MQVIEINKNNWSGEKFTLKIRKDGTFDIYGETFKVSTKNYGPDAGESAVLKVKERAGWRDVAKGFRFNGDKEDWTFYYGDITREAKIVQVAAAYLIFNIW